MSDSIFQWDATRYSVHVNSMDKEHQKLIEVMNKLYSRNQQKASKSELQGIIKELGTLTKAHFEHEEAFFEKLPNYSQAAIHKKIHEDLLRRFTEHVTAFDKSGVLTDEFFRFLKTWLQAHIAGIDMKYGHAAHEIGKAS
ncbi:MAG: bacteriohemerythrin [Bdellovibrionia bacterium]